MNSDREQVGAWANRDGRGDHRVRHRIDRRARFDCERDSFFGHVKIERGHPRYEGPLFIDATWKPGYPAALTMTGAIVDKVDQRWNEYGL